MKICIAQTKPVKGCIQSNIDNHKQLIDLALSYRAEVVIFPELSLTGYEPELANALAIDQGDSKLDDFQEISDSGQIALGVGIPTKSNTGICISMVVFQPHRARQVYSKQHLHPDEEDFFVSGKDNPDLVVNGLRIALAICYELSIPEHSETSAERGAGIYIASVAKFVNGIDKAFVRLSEIAEKHSMPTLMANCIGRSDGNTCAGKSSAWNAKGELIAQMDDMHEGIIVFDTDTQEVFIKQ